MAVYSTLHAVQVYYDYYYILRMSVHAISSTIALRKTSTSSSRVIIQKKAEKEISDILQ